MMAKPIEVFQFTQEELDARDKALIRETISELKKDGQILNPDTDQPMDYFLSRLPSCKSPKTFRKIVREKRIQPSRIIGNIPMYNPSSFVQ